MVQKLCGKPQRFDDIRYDIVDSQDQLFPVTDEEVGIGPFIQLAVGRSREDSPGFAQEVSHDIDAIVQINLGFIEVAVVDSGDLGGDIPFGETVQILGGDV